MNRLERKEQELRIVQQKLQLEERKRKIFKESLNSVKRRQHQKKIFQAGLLFEEAGILESYNREEIWLFRGNGGCFSSAIPVFMLIKWPLIFGWEV